MYVLFGPVKPESGVIPSGQENHSGPEHLNFPKITGLWFFPLRKKKKKIYIYIYIYVYGVTKALDYPLMTQI